MNVLVMGIPFWQADYGMGPYRSRCGHEVRYLAIEGEADFHFGADESAMQVMARVSASWKPDWLVCWMPELFPPPLHIEDSPIRTCAVISDWNLYYPQLEHNMARYDVVLSDKPGAETLELENAEARYLFPVYSQRSRIHRKIDSIQKDIDILFVGNLNHAIHVNRGRLLEKVASLSDKYRVAICYGYLDEAYTHMLNRARIVFNHSVRGEMNLRCFESLSCGSLLFLEEDNKEAHEYLADRLDAVFYHEDNLLDLLAYYLDHEEERAAIAAHGYAKADALALENRLDTLYDWLAQQPQGPRLFTEFPERVRSFAEVVQYTSSLVPAQERWAGVLLEELVNTHPHHPELLLAWASMLLHELNTAPESDRSALTRQILKVLQEACALASDAIIPWLNLAYVCRRGNARDAERSCLEKALAGTSCAFAGLYFGSVMDSYFATWRKAIATGQGEAAILHGAATGRLAEWWLEGNEPALALQLGEQAAALTPDIAGPYRTCGLACAALGGWEHAARYFGQARARSPFDHLLRRAEIDALLRLGRNAEAASLARRSATIFNAYHQGEQHAAAFAALAKE